MKIESDSLVDYTKTPQAPKPAAAAPEPKPDPTPEELLQLNQDIHRSMGWTPPEAPKPETIAPVPPTPTPPPTPAPAPAPAPAPTPAPAPAPVGATMGSDDVLAAVRQVARENQPAPTPAPAPAAPAVALTREDRKDYEVVQFLERSEPQKWNGLTQRYLDYVRAHYEYQETWRKANDGKVFDGDDEEHAQWYNEHPSPVTLDDIEEGREGLIEERVYNKRVKPVLDAQEQARILKEAEPQVVFRAAQSCLKMVRMFDPELAKLISDEQGNLVFNPETVAAFERANPIAKDEFDIILKDLGLWEMLKEIERTTVERADYRFNPDANPVHRQVANHIRAIEAQFMADPANKTKDGKQFITVDDWNGRCRKIAKSPGTDADKETKMQDLQSRFIAFSTDEIIDRILQMYADKVKREIQRIADLDKRRGIVATPGVQPAAPAPAPTPAPTPTPTPAPAPLPRAAKPNSPALNTPSSTVQPADPHNLPSKSVGEQMVETMYKK